MKSSRRKANKSWPRSMQMRDENHADDEYAKFRDDWEQSARTYNALNSLGEPTDYRHLSESPAFLNLTPPHAPFTLRSPRRDAYEKSRAKYEGKPKLAAIPERGARGIAAAGRYVGTLTASEIAEVDSYIGHSNLTISERSNGTGRSRRSLDDLKHSEGSSSRGGFDYPPSYTSEDKNNNKKWPHKRLSRHKLKICIGVVVALVIVGIVTSAVAIYFSLSAIRGEEDLSTVQYQFSLHLRGAMYSRKLLDNSSTTFMNLQRDICDVMRTIISDDVQTCKLDYCLEGSIIAYFRLGLLEKSRDKFEKDHLSERYIDHIIYKVTEAWTSGDAPLIVTDFWRDYDPGTFQLSTPPVITSTTTATTANTTIAATAETTTRNPATEQPTLSSQAPVPSTTQATTVQATESQPSNPTTQETTVVVDVTSQSNEQSSTAENTSSSTAGESTGATTIVISNTQALNNPTSTAAPTTSLAVSNTHTLESTQSSTQAPNSTPSSTNEVTTQVPTSESTTVSASATSPVSSTQVPSSSTQAVLTTQASSSSVVSTEASTIAPTETPSIADTSSEAPSSTVADTETPAVTGIATTTMEHNDPANSVVTNAPTPPITEIGTTSRSEVQAETTVV